MATEAVFGFIGVVLGSLSTSVLTVYKEWFATRRDREARIEQRKRDQENQHRVFQRESLVALQAAASDLLKSVYGEQDRMLIEMAETGRWSPRSWETPTAEGWEDAELAVETLRMRVFDPRVRGLAAEVKAASKVAIYAGSIDEAKRANDEMRRVFDELNDVVGDRLPALYEATA